MSGSTARNTKLSALPDFIRPMLAKSGSPFDSEDHLFEIKWDGLRMTAYVDQGSYRLRSRRGGEMTDRYPELAELASLPDGTVLDGELVALDEAGRPDFAAVMQREQARSPLRIQQIAKSIPTTYVVFDQLYDRYEPLLNQPLQARRGYLTATVAALSTPRVAASEGVIGPGKQFFHEVVERELEGLVAKRLDSPYSAGRRSDAWIKIRRRASLLCAIIGYMPKGDDFESLILAADDAGELRYVGRVGSGFSDSIRDEINALLRSCESDRPLVDCEHRGCWLQAGLYCSVNFLEWTRNRELREPVFEKLIEVGE